MCDLKYKLFEWYLDSGAVPWNNSVEAIRLHFLVNKLDKTFKTCSNPDVHDVG